LIKLINEVNNTQKTYQVKGRNQWGEFEFTEPDGTVRFTTSLETLEQWVLRAFYKTFDAERPKT
jgi:hypothetical protein